MGYLQSGAHFVSGPSVSNFNLTVPAGVTPDQHVLIVVCGALTSGLGTDVTCTKAGATFSTVKPSVVQGTMWAQVVKGTGLSAGDVILCTLAASRQVSAQHYYFDQDFGAPGAWGARSSTTTVCPAVATTAGQAVAIVGVERSTNTPTTVSGVVNSNGRVVANRHYVEDGAVNPLCSYYLGDFVEAGTDSGSSTITYANTTATTAGLGMHLPLVDPTPPSSGQITTAMTSWFGPTFLRGGWMTLAGATVRMAASVNADLSGAVFSPSTAVPASGWVTARVDGLSPDTAYHVGLEINGVLQTDGRTRARTTPTPGSQSSFTVIAGSCQVTGSNHASLARAALEDAAYLLHFGDLHYSDDTVEADWRTAVTSSLTSPNMKALLAAFGFQWIYDNHDWGGDLSWSGSPAGTFVPAAYRQLTGDLDHPVAAYRTWVHGRVRFIRTDQYSQRSDPADVDGPGKVLLGATQKQWWKDTLEAATEPVIVWASGWPNHDMAGGRWKTYTTDVQDMEDWLDARPDIKRRLVCVGGDSHDIRADSGTRPPVWQAFSGVPSLNASPFNQSGSIGETQSWDIGQIDVPDDRGVYSRLTFADNGDHIVMLWEAVEDDGTVMLAWDTTFLTDPGFAGDGELTAETAAVPAVAAPFSGSGALSAVVEAEGVVTLAAPFGGSGQLSALAAVEAEVPATLSGDGELAALVEADAEVQALFGGEGALDAQVEIPADIEVEAMFGGTGTLSATIIPVMDGCLWPVVEPECCPAWDAATPAERARAVERAAEYLWAATGRQFGTCVLAVRPCGLAHPCPSCGAGGFPWVPTMVDGEMRNIACAPCRCSARCEVALPGHVAEIVQVRVDGAIVPPSAYRVDNSKWLVRDDGECWPDCQDFGARGGDPGTFEVTYLEGVPVPLNGQVALGELACTLIRDCPSGGDCGSCTDDQALGTQAVADWVALVNPHGLAQPPMLIVPGARGGESSGRMQTWP